MDDAFLVRFLERLGDLSRDRDCIAHGHRPAPEAFGEILSVDELHREEMRDGSVRERRLLEGVELGDVRVVERGEDLRLALEAGEAVGVGGEGRGQQLQGDVAVEARVGRAVDLAHSSGADRGDDLVRAETASG